MAQALRTYAIQLVPMMIDDDNNDDDQLIMIMIMIMIMMAMLMLVLNELHGNKKDEFDDEGSL